MKRWRNTILGTLIVLSGVGAAGLTVLARRSGEWELTRLGAIASIVFAVLIVIFVVPPLAKSARAEAARLDLSFQVTGGGVVFVCIYTVVAFAAWNTGNNLLFLVFSVLSSTLFVAVAAGRASLRDLVVTARFPDHIFASDPAPVIVTVNNTKRLLPSLSIVVEARERVETRRPRGLFRRERERKRALAYFMYLPHRAKVEQRVEQTFAARGRILVTGFELSTRFPFGFFRLRRRLRARDVEIIVYPKPVGLGDELHLLPIDAGQLEGQRRGAGHDLHSLREYQPQDDVRHIHWKATARHGRLVVREFTAEDERRVHIVLDTFVEDNPEALLRFERAVTVAGSLVAHFVEERAEVRLSDGEGEARYSAGREHLYACLRRLALVEPRRAEPDSLARHDFWQRVELPTAEAGYVILVTTAPRGSIPADLWRKSHVIHL